MQYRSSSFNDGGEIPVGCIVCSSHPFPATASGLLSSVCPMKPRNAAHRLAVVDAAPPAVVLLEFICARFFAKRSLSWLSSFCFRLRAPGLLLVAVLRMMCTCSSGLLPVAVFSSASSPVVGSASVKESNVVTSFLFGRRRLFLLSVALLTLNMRLACLMRLLSSLVVGKRLSILDFEVFAELAVAEDLRIDFAGREVRWEGLMGAMLVDDYMLT